MLALGPIGGSKLILEPSRSRKQSRSSSTPPPLQSCIFDQTRQMASSWVEHEHFEMPLTRVFFVSVLQIDLLEKSKHSPLNRRFPLFKIGRSCNDNGAPPPHFLLSTTHVTVSVLCNITSPPVARTRLMQQVRSTKPEFIIPGFEIPYLQ